MFVFYLTDEPIPPTPAPSNVTSKLKDKVKETLSRSLTKTCDQNSVTVAVEKSVLQVEAFTSTFLS